jgi:hypothetical protein
VHQCARNAEQQQLYYTERFGLKSKVQCGYLKMPTIKAVLKKSTTSRKQRAIRNRFIPYSIFYDRYPTFSDEVIKAKWRAKLIDPSVKKIKHKGQVCIHEFRGIDLDALEMADATMSLEQDPPELNWVCTQGPIISAVSCNHTKDGEHRS